jgi:hypothetical protein
VGTTAMRPIMSPVARSLFSVIRTPIFLLGKSRTPTDHPGLQPRREDFTKKL